MFRVQTLITNIIYSQLIFISKKIESNFFKPKINFINVRGFEGGKLTPMPQHLFCTKTFVLKSNKGIRGV